MFLGQKNQYAFMLTDAVILPVLANNQWLMLFLSLSLTAGNFSVIFLTFMLLFEQCITQWTN